MNRSQRELARKISKTLLPTDEYERLLEMPIKDEGYGFDSFGMERETTMLAYTFLRVLYKEWFRVESRGHENIPRSGNALIVSNHSGVVPADAAMIVCDIAYKLERPRIPRTLVDNFMGFLPFLNVFFYRVGQVVGARRNFEDLLKSGELVNIFPEGTKGLGKPYSQKYKLARFNVGFIELALKLRVPIVPTAVVGAEEQLPMIYNIKSIARLLNIPYFPVTPLFPLLGPAGIMPLPVKYHIQYGEQIHLYEDYPPETVNDPEKIQGLADKIQIAVQEMINQMLETRESVFDWKSKKERSTSRRRRKTMPGE